MANLWSDGHLTWLVLFWKWRWQLQGACVKTSMFTSGWIDSWSGFAAKRMNESCEFVLFSNIRQWFVVYNNKMGAQESKPPLEYDSALSVFSPEEQDHIKTIFDTICGEHVSTTAGQTQGTTGFDSAQLQVFLLKLHILVGSLTIWC